MTVRSTDVEDVERLVESPGLAGALESEHFKKFLDHVPVAIAVSELRESEVVIYANSEFERVSGRSSAELEGQYWDIVAAEAPNYAASTTLASAIVATGMPPTVFQMRGSDQPVTVELHSNLIENDDGVPTFRLVALIDAAAGDPNEEDLAARIREKDTQLRELQHRVKNNLQMITALIRMETRNANPSDQHGYSRLAGRVASLALLYTRFRCRKKVANLTWGYTLARSLLPSWRRMQSRGSLWIFG